MPNNKIRSSTHEDAWVEHPDGRIFVRTWHPMKAASHAVASSPIVLFHDSLGCIELWRNFPARLSESTGRSVVAYDRLGFGKSDRRHGKPGMDFIAEEAEIYFPVICEQLGLERFIAFGHSVGGSMATYCAARFAEACDALITESTQAFVDERIVQGILAAKELFKQDEQISRLKKYHGNKTQWVLDAWIETWLNPEFAEWSLKSILPKVTCPLLVIHGDQDEYGSSRHPEMIAELSSGPLRVEILADTYHVPHREREQTIVDLTKEFIGSIAYIQRHADV